MSRILFAAAAALVLGFASDASAAKKTLVLVHDRSGTPEAYVFSVDAAGLMTPVTNSPFGVGGPGNPTTALSQTVAYSKKRKQVFFAHDDGINVMNVAADGTLGQLATAPFLTTIGSGRGVTVYERKKRVFVYVTDFTNNRVHAFESIASTGDLVEVTGSPFATGAGPTGLDNRDGVLCVMNATAGTISSFKIAKDGTLTASPTGAQSTTIGSCDHCWFEPTGRFLFTSGATGKIVSFKVKKATGDLTIVPPGATSIALTTPGGLALGGNFVSIAWRDAPGDAVDAQAFRITNLGNVQPFNNTQDLDMGAIDAIGIKSNGKFVAAASNEDGVVRTFHVQPSTGLLTNTDEEAIAADAVQTVLVIKR